VNVVAFYLSGDGGGDVNVTVTSAREQKAGPTSWLVSPGKVSDLFLWDCMTRAAVTVLLGLIHCRTGAICMEIHVRRCTALNHNLLYKINCN
jgi:hypothetical protein